MKSKDQKRREAKERQAEYDKLTPLQKLTLQREAGHNGTKQVIRLAKEVANEKGNLPG